MSKNILILDKGLTHTMWEMSIFYQCEGQAVERVFTGRWALEYTCRKWKPDLIAVGSPADMPAIEFARQLLASTLFLPLLVAWHPEMEQKAAARYEAQCREHGFQFCVSAPILWTTLRTWAHVARLSEYRQGG